MREKQRAEVLSQTALAAGIYDLRLAVPEIAESARAGQFVNVYCVDKSRLLPRPVSLAGIDRKNGMIRLVYRVSGAGTEEFSRLGTGDTIEILGPLGNGFPLDEARGKEVFLIGGGIGVPPLLETAGSLRNMYTAGGPGEDRMRITAVLGYRDSCTFLAQEFAEVCDRVLIASEDGSAGTRGTVLDAMRENGVFTEQKGSGTADSVWFACGPSPMLKALQTCAAENKTACWLSLEERMACGVGACLACVCKTKEIDEHSRVKNRRVCKDGPVFRAEEIVL